MLADGDGVAAALIAAVSHDTVGVEAAVGPHGEWSGGSGVAHSGDGLAQKVGVQDPVQAVLDAPVAPRRCPRRAVLALPLRSRAINMLSVPAAMANSG